MLFWKGNHRAETKYAGSPSWRQARISLAGDTYRSGHPLHGSAKNLCPLPGDPSRRSEAHTRLLSLSGEATCRWPTQQTGQKDLPERERERCAMVTDSPNQQSDASVQPYGRSKY